MKFLTSLLYILDEDGRTPIPCEDVLTWDDWMTKTHFEQRIVQKTWINGIEVSTVFTGFNNQIWETEPKVFETMVLDIDLSFRLRSSTWDQALADHEQAIAWLKTQTQ